MRQRLTNKTAQVKLDAARQLEQAARLLRKVAEDEDRGTASNPKALGKVLAGVYAAEVRLKGM